MRGVEWRTMTTQELRELDAWIAEKVMGDNGVKIWYASKDGGESGSLFSGELITRKDVSEFCQRHPEYAVIERVQYPHYTTSPADAMEVLNKCLRHAADHNLDAVEMYAEPDGVVVSINDDEGGQIMVKAATTEPAICLFARELFSQPKET